jgi:hypothetical protein
MRKFMCAVVVVLAVCSVAVSDEFTGIITKVEDGKVTFTKFDFQSQEKSDPKTLPTAKDLKVLNAKFNKEEMKLEAGEPVEKGLKNDMFTDIGEKGLFAQITTDKDNKTITELRVFGKKKKGGD